MNNKQVHNVKNTEKTKKHALNNDITGLTFIIGSAFKAMAIIIHPNV